MVAAGGSAEAAAGAPKPWKPERGLQVSFYLAVLIRSSKSGKCQSPK